MPVNIEGVMSEFYAQFACHRKQFKDSHLYTRRMFPPSLTNGVSLMGKDIPNRDRRLTTVVIYDSEVMNDAL